MLCDRFIDSTVAYQGYANQLSFDANGNKNNLIEQMNAYALQNGYFPEATFFIDVDEKERQKRLSIRGIENRYDDSNLDDIAEYLSHVVILNEDFEETCKTAKKVILYFLTVLMHL